MYNQTAGCTDLNHFLAFIFYSLYMPINLEQTA